MNLDEPLINELSPLETHEMSFTENPMEQNFPEISDS